MSERQRVDQGQRVGREAGPPAQPGRPMSQTPTLDVSRVPARLVSVFASIALSILVVRVGIARKQARSGSEAAPDA
ncbi:MAG: hypothetical protein QOF92_4575 [Pseudonocardiales bacterium]|nr:hypothetical protein [Pseudonocardiales bacterium]